MVEHLPGARSAPDDRWFALIRAPEGLTVIREHTAEGTGDELWTGFYGDSAHALDLPGMLVALVGPLAAAAVPVFVASTYHADVVLVPSPRKEEAISVLQRAGHEVGGPV
ncbi:ACT domain-containing protein [Actinacidiphila yanglinensis]|uniref:ACT domain-containing protein n=1 Tax=Actinacidiphila yanglinensis TaxID=310779 RepID=UPI001F26E672|nr:ACT domain-containing protein [Actinacidiphila yanglinensis]